MTDWTVAQVLENEPCFFCNLHGVYTIAVVDAATTFEDNPWAFMCDGHWRKYGYYGHLGLGIGQRLILKEANCG